MGNKKDYFFNLIQDCRLKHINMHIQVHGLTIQLKSRYFHTKKKLNKIFKKRANIFRLDLKKSHTPTLHATYERPTSHKGTDGMKTKVFTR